MDYIFVSDRDQVYDTHSASKKTYFFSRDLNGDEEFYDEIPANMLEGKNVLVLIHGYNNDKNEVLNAYWMIRSRIDLYIDETKKYDTVIGYMWPGYHYKFDYFPAKINAQIVAPRLSQLLSKFSVKCAALDVMAHSMGNRIFFDSLIEKKFTKKIRNMFCLAAAIDNEKIEKGETYHDGIESNIERLYVFHSKNDKTLKIAYLIAELDRALGYKGPEKLQNITSNTRVINATSYIGSHGNYKESDEFYKVWNEILQGALTVAN